MNPPKQITYETANQPSNDDIFEALIKKIRSLRIIIDQHKQAWQYLMYAGLMLLLAIMAYFSTTN